MTQNTNYQIGLTSRQREIARRRKKRAQRKALLRFIGKILLNAYIVISAIVLISWAITYIDIVINNTAPNAPDRWCEMTKWWVEVFSNIAHKIRH